MSREVQDLQGGGSDGDDNTSNLLDATINDILNHLSEYASLAKDNLAMKEVSHMYMLCVFFAQFCCVFGQ